MADTNLSAFIWSVADLLRGDFKQSDYGKVILPFTVLRRLDCVLEPTKEAVLEQAINDERVRRGLVDILVNFTDLYELLRGEKKAG